MQPRVSGSVSSELWVTAVFASHTGNGVDSLISVRESCSILKTDLHVLKPVRSSLDKFSCSDGCGNLLQQELYMCVSTSDGFSLMVNGTSLIHNTSPMQGASETTLMFYRGLLPLEPHYLFFQVKQLLA